MAAFKAKVALEALKEEKTTVEIAEIYDIHQPGYPVGKVAAGEGL